MDGEKRIPPHPDVSLSKYLQFRLMFSINGIAYSIITFEYSPKTHITKLCPRQTKRSHLNTKSETHTHTRCREANRDSVACSLRRWVLIRSCGSFWGCLPLPEPLASLLPRAQRNHFSKWHTDFGLKHISSSPTHSRY